MNKQEAEWIWKKLEEWTRCDITARLGPFKSLEYGDYAMKAIEIENEIREKLFGSSDILVLARKFSLMLRSGGVRTKKKVRKKKKKVQTI